MGPATVSQKLESFSRTRTKEFVKKNIVHDMLLPCAPRDAMTKRFFFEKNSRFKPKHLGCRLGDIILIIERIIQVFAGLTLNTLNFLKDIRAVGVLQLRDVLKGLGEIKSNQSKRINESKRESFKWEF